MRAPVAMLVVLGACSAPPAHEFPEASRTAFHRTCPETDPHCACAWDAITRSMTHEDYEAAMARFAKEGRMDHRLTAARAACVDAK